jgi:hypothetical protein
MGGEAPLGRVRKGASWTWAAACDTRIDWPRIELHATFQVDGTSFDEETQEFNPHSYAEGSYVLVSGLIQPVSIRTDTKPSILAKTYPLLRHCQVVEWGRRHSENSQLLVRCHGYLVEPSKNKPSETTQEVDSDHKQPAMYGNFWPDYRFWETEEELQETLQHVYFLLLGTERRRGPLWIDGLVDPLRIDGLVLKPRLHQWKDSKGRYERIGWLRYCTLEYVKESEWTPRGTPSKLTLL